MNSIRLNKTYIINKLAYVSVPVAILICWKLFSDFHLINTVALPSPDKVASSIFKLTLNGKLFKHIEISIQRVLYGYFIAAFAGIVMGIGVGLSRFLNRITDFLFQLLKPIPPIAWIPLAIIWFGIGESSKIFLIFLGGFFPVFINVTDGIRHVDMKYVEVSQVLGASWLRFIVRLVIPGALPSIMTGLRVGIGSAWVCVVAAELIAADKGIGYMIMDARQLSQPEIVIVGMITIGIIGKLMDTILRRFEGLLLRWKASS